MFLAVIGKYERFVPFDYKFAIADRSAVITIVPTVASFVSPEALWSAVCDCVNKNDVWTRRSRCDDAQDDDRVFVTVASQVPIFYRFIDKKESSRFFAVTKTRVHGPVVQNDFPAG
jgi:hypothetical protein